MKQAKQKFILSLKIAGIIFALALLLIFIFRNSLIDTVIARLETKMMRDYQCDFSVKKAVFAGVTSLHFEDISLLPKQKDTLIYIEKLDTKINFWKLFLGEVQLGKLEVSNGFVQLVKNKNGSNFEVFLNSKKDTISSNRANYGKLTYRILSNLLNLIPTDLQLKNFDLKIDDTGNKVIFDCATMILINKKLTSSIRVKSDLKEQLWSVSGFADPRNNKMDLVLSASKNDTIKVPFLEKKFNLKTGFKSIHFVLNEMEMSRGILNLKGTTSVQNLFVYHPKISNKEMVLRHAQFDYNFNFGKRFIAIDSTSKIQINQLIIKPYLCYTNDVDKIYSLQFQIPKINAQDFVESLPEGLLPHIEGMKAKGSFNYSLNFEYNNHHEDQLIFESAIKADKLKITQYGETDLNKINREFTYRAIEKGILQRPILVGISNSFFTPFSEISPYLIKSVVTSEDPSFMHHRGFINDAFKQSILKNIRTKKFARGASTISMQLVKNVFLTREKTLSRKLEEIILVYILENQRITSKERMMEVYFNVIEFGPNVYGIGEAAMFYFQKKPKDLTLNESLFLATIIPRPKGFMYKFDASQQLKVVAKQENRFLTNTMLRRSILEPNDTIGQSFPIKITGHAQLYLKSKSSSNIEIDSTSNDDFDF
ncbi:transglycosylase domain-containing protein [Flavobacterium sp.]